jgi:hypothetical protein
MIFFFLKKSKIKNIINFVFEITVAKRTWLKGLTNDPLLLNLIKGIGTNNK